MSFPNLNIMGLNINVLTVFVSLLIGGLIAFHTFCGCSTIFNTKKEGFNGAPLDWQLSSGLPNDTWTKPPVNADQAHNSMYASLAGNKGGPVPPTGLFMWAQNLFKPECCHTPQQYPSSTGCACISQEQMKFISERGGNNTLP